LTGHFANEIEVNTFNRYDIFMSEVWNCRNWPYHFRAYCVV